MRAWGDGIVWFLQLDPADDLDGREIEFGDARGIPQAAPGAAAVARGHDRVRKRRGVQVVSTEVEALENLTAGNLEQNDVVGKIVGNEEFVVAIIFAPGRN